MTKEKEPFSGSQDVPPVILENTQPYGTDEKNLPLDKAGYDKQQAKKKALDEAGPKVPGK